MTTVDTEPEPDCSHHQLKIILRPIKQREQHPSRAFLLLSGPTRAQKPLGRSDPSLVSEHGLHGSAFEGYSKDVTEGGTFKQP
jgi:hypothetical protein